MGNSRLLQFMSRSLIAIAALVFFTGVQTTLAQSTIFVSSTTGSDAFDGTTANISGASGPKQTLLGVNGALSIATAGDIISIEAGNYPENFDFIGTGSLTVEVRQAGAVTVATFTGTSTIAPGAAATIALNSGVGSVAVGGGTFTLTNGVINLGAGKLAFTVATTLNVASGTATGASPSYTGAVTANYNGTVASAGTEIPINLNGGTLTVNQAASLTFNSALVAGTVNIAGTAAANTVTFSNAVTASGNVLNNSAGTVNYSSVSVTNGRFANLGGGNVTVSGIFQASISANNVAGISGEIANPGGTVTFGSVTVTGFNNDGSGAAPALQPFSYLINNAGTLTVNGAITNDGQGDANDNDTAVISLTNTGTMSIGVSSSIAGVLNNGGGTLGLGATTFTLTGAGPHVNMGTITGAASTVVVSGASFVPASAGAAAPAFDVAGNLTVSGNGGITGAVSVAGNVTNTGTGNIGNADADVLRVGGNLSNTGGGTINDPVVVGGNLTQGAGNVTANGSFDVAGTASFTGATAFNGGAGTNDVDGLVTISGAVVVNGAGNAIFGSGTVTGAGSLTISAGATLTVNGNFDTSNGGVFVANGGGATLAFVINGSTSATYTPGPNTLVDTFTLSRAAATTGTATLVLGQSFAIQAAFTTNANTAINLGNFLVRHSTAGAVATVNGTISTPTGQDGAISFENTGQSLSGLGQISNVLINVGGGNTLAVPGAGAATTLLFTGDLTLFTGGIAIAGGSEIKPTGTTARVRRNSADATTLIAGPFNTTAPTGTYVLEIFGGAAVAAGSEYALTGISSLNLVDTGTAYTLPANPAATVGNVNTAAGTTLDLATNTADVNATGVVTHAGTFAGAVGDQIVLLGDNQTHSFTGVSTADLSVQAAGVTVNGTATIPAAPATAALLTNIIVGDNAAGTGSEAATFANIQQIDGTVFVDTDGSLTLGLVADDANALTGNNDEGSVDGLVTVANGGALTWSTDAVIDAGATVGTAPIGAAPTFDFNGQTVHTTGAAFNAVSNAVLGSSGSLELDAATNVDTNIDLAASAAVLPGLRVDVGSALTGPTAVTGLTDINAALIGGQALTLSGTVNVGAGITNNVTIIGTTVQAEGPQTITGTLTLNASNVDFQGDAAAGNNPDQLTVTGLYTHTAGAVTLTGVDVITNAGVTFTAGSYAATAATASNTATPAGDFLVMNGGALTIGANALAVPNLEVRAAVNVAVGDVLQVDDFLWLNAPLTISSAGAAPVGTLNLGDGNGGLTINASGAGNTVTRTAGVVPGNLVLGAEANSATVIYDTADPFPTGLELFDTVGSLITKTAVTLADARAVTATTVDVAAGQISIDANDDGDNSITLPAAGNFLVGVNTPFFDAAGGQVVEVLTFGDATNYNLTFYAAATATSNQSWAPGATPNVTVTPAGAGAVALHANRSATDMTVAAGDVFDPSGNTFTVLGALNLNGNPLAVQNGGLAPAAGGSVAFAGSAAQTITGGLFYNGNVTINNAAGVTLVGGNLNTSNNAAGAVCNAAAAGNNGNIGNNLTLTNGALATGTNNVILCHQNTTNQGFTRTSGSIFGNVQAVVDGTASPNTTDRVEFPLGDADMNYRPFAITFNTPNTLAADPVLVASYNANNAGGINGLPIAAVDELNNPFEIGRYATDFHWSVTSTPTVTPSINYDVEYRSAGFANFVDEDIEKTRAIRRQDGNPNNFWIKVANGPANNDNFAVSGTEPVLVARNAVGAINADGVLFAIGLENNLASTDPAAITLNAGNNEVIDLTTVFDGGSPNNAAPTYAYAVTDGDAAVATGATAGDDLTVTGVAVGTSTVTVQATDIFGAVATATVAVTVNEAFVAGEALADVTVNDGTADQTVDGSVASTGGTAPIGYAVATSDAAVATAAVDAAGEITLTFVGTGTATITLTATDAEGDTVVTTFDVNVNAALVAAGGLADVTVEEGADAAVDASAEFTGGTVATDYAFSVESADPSVATATNTDAAVTVTGVQPYVVTGGVVTADTAPVTITVTATDDLGATGTSTFTADVNPVAGNVDGSGGPTEVGASLTLDAFVGLQTLTAKQTIAADFNTSGTVNAFDAALIFDAFVNGKSELVEFPAAAIAYGDLNHEGNLVSIPVQITGNTGDTRALSFSTTIDPAYAKVIGIESTLGDGWIVRSATNEEDGSVALAAAGYGSMTSDGTVAILTLELVGTADSFNLRAEGAVNDNPVANVDELEVVELPETFALNGNYPNPFNAATTISFDLPQAAEVEIEVYDLIGRRVMSIPTQTMQAGAKRSVQVDGTRLASGSYFYRVIAKMDNKTIVETDRMMLVK